MNYDSYIIALLVVFVFIGGGLYFSGAIVTDEAKPEVTSETGPPAKTDTAAPPPVKEGVLPPFVYFEVIADLAPEQEKLSKTLEFAHVCSSLFKLVELGGVVEPEVPEAVKTEHKEVPEIKKEIEAVGFKVIELLPVLAKSSYKHLGANTNQFIAKDRHQKWQQWISATFELAANNSGKWYMADAIEKSDNITMGSKAGEIAGQMLQLKRMPLPANPLFIPTQAKLILSKLNKSKPEHVRAAFSGLWKSDPSFRTWLSLFAKYYTNQGILETLSNWFGGSGGFMTPERIPRRIIIHSMSRITGGCEKLMKFFSGNVTDMEKQSIIYALARRRCTAAIPMIKRLASLEEKAENREIPIGVQMNVIRALEFYKSKEHAKVCLEILANKSISRDVRINSLLPYAVLYQGEAMDKFADIFASQDEVRMLAVIEALRMVKTERSLEFLSEIKTYSTDKTLVSRANQSHKQLSNEMNKK